jgi:hypothetical protein
MAEAAKSLFDWDDVDAWVQDSATGQLMFLTAAEQHEANANACQFVRCCGSAGAGVSILTSRLDGSSSLYVASKNGSQEVCLERGAVVNIGQSDWSLS